MRGKNPASPRRVQLSEKEVAVWASRLARRRDRDQNEQTGRLREIVAECSRTARIVYQVRTKPFLIRVDKALPELASRLIANRNELLALPGEVTAALRVRFRDYDLAMNA